jgi:hypothetical protein
MPLATKNLCIVERQVLEVLQKGVYKHMVYESIALLGRVRT